MIDNFFFFSVLGTFSHNILNKLGQISPVYFDFEQDSLVLILEAKNSEQSARQYRGLSALRYHRLPYHIIDVGLLAPLSSSLDYSHLLNYFLETNLFFNLRQMAIWPTVIVPFSLVWL